MKKYPLLRSAGRLRSPERKYWQKMAVGKSFDAFLEEDSITEVGLPSTPRGGTIIPGNFSGRMTLLLDIFH